MDADARIKYRTINNSIDFPWISIMNQNNKDLEDDGNMDRMPWVVFEDIVDGATNAILDELRPAHSCSWTLSLAQNSKHLRHSDPECSRGRSHQHWYRTPRDSMMSWCFFCGSSVRWLHVTPSGGCDFIFHTDSLGRICRLNSMPN